MGSPGLTPGGKTLTSSSSKESKGVFAEQPGATLKYAINKGLRDNEHRETMARMFIQMPKKERDAFVKSVPPETRALAKILAGAESGAANGTGFVDFLLQNAVEPFQEKFQVVETLSDNFIIYLFGQQAPMFQYSGMLLNTYQDDQRVWMTRLYQDVLRGTQLARRRKLVRLRYDSVIVSGVMVTMQQQVQGELENGVPFSFTLIPTQYVIFTPALGVPTTLQTPFIESGGLGLDTVAPTDTKQVRVASPSRPPLPTRTRTNDKSTTPSLVAPTKKGVASLLASRATTKKTAPTTLKNVRGGQVQGQK